jgi:hypothetical protein
MLFAQAAVLSLLAACSPVAMLIAAIYLVSAQPRRMAVLYLAGGVLVVTVVGTIALVAIRAGGLSRVSGQQPRYGLRLGLGVIALIAATVIALRTRRAAEPPRQRQPGLVTRMSARQTPLSAFVVGLIVFGPGLTFIAAVQVVATAQASLVTTVAAMTMIVVLTVLFAWLPLVAYLIAPEATVGRLAALNAALGRHGRVVLASALAVIGVLLVIQGSIGLAR